METFIVRVWLPDRPGALGAVAGRIGSVRGDVVGIDILERGGGRAIDELVVQLPSADLVELLVREVRAVDGVSVEDVRPVRGAVPDPGVDALEAAAALVAATTGGELLEALVAHVAFDLGAEWVAVLDADEPRTVAEHGSVPPAPWLGAFVAGSRTSAAVAAGEAGPDDLAWAPLAEAGLCLVVGRSGRPLRARERRSLTALARITDLRLCELGRR